MNGGAEIVVSPETLLRLFAILLFVPAVLLAFRRVIPSLSPAAKRLAVFMLAAQLLVIAVALGHNAESSYAFWLWHLDLEWNIPSLLASTQLALVGGIALALAWIGRGDPVAHRLYLVALAVFFLILSLEEFFSWKDSMSETDWRSNYAILGAAVFIATALYAAHTPKRARAWLTLLLIALSVIAIGGGVIDSLPEACGDLGLLRIEGCLYFNRSPEEIVEMLGGWLALLAMLNRLSRATAPLPPRIWWLLCLLAAFWILLLIHFSPVKDLEVPPPAQPASVQFESNAQLHGFQTDKRGLPAIAFMFLPYDVDIKQFGFSVHIVDQLSGDSVASRETVAHRRYVVWPGGRGYEPVYAQAIDIALPPETPVNRALWVLFSHWREIDGQFVPQAVVASDLRLLNETQVVLGELALPAESTSSTASTLALAVFENGFALNHVDMPERARAGATVKLSFNWGTEVPGSEDYAQFLHFVNNDSGAQWGHDQQPLGPRLPTRLWYSGLRDSETWEVTVPANIAAGNYAVFTGLYRASDLVRVAARDPDGMPYADARVPLGEMIVEA